MTVFWIVAALFLLGALLLMLPGLLWPPAAPATSAAANIAVHRDQLLEAEQDLAAGLISPERFDQTRQDIQRRVLEDSGPGTTQAARPARRTAVALALLVPLASVLTYLQLGQPGAAAPQAVVASAQAAPGARHSVTPEQIQQMVAALAERLKAQPADQEGWLMLGRSYTALQRYRDAATAFRRAADLGPPDAGVLADLADVTGMAQGKRLAGEPARLVQQALDVDPRHVKALALAGSVAFEARDYGAARGYWQRLVAVVPAESPMARSVQNSIDQATQMEASASPTAGVAVAQTTQTAQAGAPAQAAQPPLAAAPAAAASAVSAVSGRVKISPELAARVAAGDTLFVFARAAQGPRMPLAILRRPADAAGADFVLDDSLAMSPALRLSGAAQVVVGARISRSGNATPQPGDLVGQSGVVAPGATGVQVLIDRVQP
jgi:cytochrome c-type biogenesis protein CcmH